MCIFVSVIFHTYLFFYAYILRIKSLVKYGGFDKVFITKYDLRTCNFAFIRRELTEPGKTRITTQNIFLHSKKNYPNYPSHRLYFGEVETHYSKKKL